MPNSMAKSTINEHVNNVYDEGELKKEDTMRKIGNSEFSTKPTNYYNLDMIQKLRNLSYFSKKFKIKFTMQFLEKVRRLLMFREISIYMIRLKLKKQTEKDIDFVNGIVKEVETRKVLTKEKNKGDVIDAILTHPVSGLIVKANKQIDTEYALTQA